MSIESTSSLHRRNNAIPQEILEKIKQNLLKNPRKITQIYIGNKHRKRTQALEHDQLKPISNDLFDDDPYQLKKIHELSKLYLK